MLIWRKKNEKNYKIRKDLSITVNGHTLFRIEAIKEIAIHNVSKGELGGYIETEDNLSGNAWVYGDKITNNKDVYNICCNDTYNITILPNFIKIGCQFHKKEEWWKFTNREIEAMDGLKAIRFWKKWKPILQAICGENK